LKMGSHKLFACDPLFAWGLKLRSSQSQPAKQLGL
jgi:hypothetical protein